MPKLKSSKTEETLAAYSDIADLATAEMKRRLEEDVGAVSLSQLNFLAGTATDKIAKYEGWERAGHGEAGEWVQKLVQGLAQIGSGAKLSLEVTPLPEFSAGMGRYEVKTLPAEFTEDAPEPEPVNVVENPLLDKVRARRLRDAL